MSRDIPRNDRPTDADVLQNALWQSRVTMTLLVVMLAGLITAILYFSTATASLPIDESAVIARAKERLEANQEKILQEVASFVGETSSPIATTFAHQIREDLPVYARALNDQSDELIAGLEDQIRQRVRAQTDEFVAKHRNILKEEFPEITSEETREQILRDYRRTANRLLERYYLDDFAKEAKKTVSIWQKIKPIESPVGEPLRADLLEYVSDWLVLQAQDRASNRIFPELSDDEQK